MMKTTTTRLKSDLFVKDGRDDDVRQNAMTIQPWRNVENAKPNARIVPK